MAMAPAQQFSVPADWTIYGDPCPCCGAEGDYEESDDDGWWMHATNPDGCTWRSQDTEPCPRWPHKGRSRTVAMSREHRGVICGACGASVDSFLFNTHWRPNDVGGACITDRGTGRVLHNCGGGD